ncbi:MAG: 30S ribosomal protein S6 [bacterium]
MKKYEVMFIVRANLEESVIKSTVADMQTAFTANDSKVLECKEIGLKDLAYEIEKAKKGYYVLLTVEATADALVEFNRRANISETVVRHITVQLNN